MFLHRADNSWQQWLHVSKYPPSLTYYSLELGILFLCLALLRTLELQIGVRENGVFYVFGETAMFFYIVHRLARWPGSYLHYLGDDACIALSGVPLVSEGQSGASPLDLEAPVELDRSTLTADSDPKLAPGRIISRTTTGRI